MKIVRRSRLVCPKCGGTFDYDWVPGASLTSFRLMGKRYMACPLCHRWSTFDVQGSEIPTGTEDPGQPLR
jgi:formate dehydrogenase maturation protein FdhE